MRRITAFLLVASGISGAAASCARPSESAHPEHAQAAAVEFFNLVVGARLTAAEKADLVAFLRVL